MKSTTADGTLRFALTHQQMHTLAAVVDRIVPADETCGASDAGVVEFIIGLLNAELCAERETYIQGLDGIEREAVAEHGRSFARLSSAEQDALLTTLEADRARTAWVVPPQPFFQMLVEHVLEGFYADPGNGGNAGAVSWKMIGYKAEGGTS